MHLAAAARASRVALGSGASRSTSKAAAIIDLTSSPDSSPPRRSFASKPLSSRQARPASKPRYSATTISDDSDSSLPPSDPALPEPPSAQPRRTLGNLLVQPVASTSRTTIEASSTRPEHTAAERAPAKPVKSRATLRERNKRRAAVQAEREEFLMSTYQPWHLEGTAEWPKPKIVYTQDRAEAERVLATMKGPLAFDMEWTPSKRVGHENITSILQFADRKTCLVFQLTGPQKVLPRGITDPLRIKLGVHINGDAQKLTRDFNKLSNPSHHVHPAGLLELSALARQVDPERSSKALISLQWLVGSYLSLFMPKMGGPRSQSWDNVPLTPGQQRYAAGDVWASIQLYYRLMGLAEVAERKIDVESMLFAVHWAQSTPPTGAEVRGASPTPRQREAWELLYGPEKIQGAANGGPLLDAAASRMGIQASTVISYVCEAALNRTPPLEVDAAQLQRVIAAQDWPVVRSRYGDGLAALIKASTDV